MQIIKDNQIISDNWVFITDDETAPATGNICISLQRWQSCREELLQRNGKLGIRLNPEEQLDSIAKYIDAFNLIEVYFPAFTDGRAFSQAWLLRNRHGYTGELRAVGNFIRDQLFYLHRVGFNSFNLQTTTNLQSAISALNDFSVKYQTSTC